jgi:hypothetical protein
MQKLKLNDVSLVIVDCLDIDRAIKAVNITDYYCEFENIDILSSIEKPDCKYNIIPIHPINSKVEYSEFMIREFNKYIKTDYVLVIQWDGFVLNPAAWTEEFKEYDYIGSPVRSKHWGKSSQRDLVGNGGFSLRTKKLHDFIATNRKFVMHRNEDTAICYTNYELLRGNNIIIAPYQLANQFGFQSGNYINSFGFHEFRTTNLANWKDYKLFFG